MNNILSYTETNLDTFVQRPPGSVDSLILSWVAYWDLPPETQSWQGIPLRDLFRAELFPTLFQEVWDPDSTKALLTALAASPRFREVRIMGRTIRKDLTQETQFSAVTFQLTPGLHYVAFGGTDTSFVGWKENFNMTFLSPVPAQEEVARYLSQAASHCAGDLLVGGHSKGGNLAVYAASSVSPQVQARIVRTYCHDGPGFPKAFYENLSYQTVCDRIEKTVPQASIVGLLLDNRSDYQVIRSTRHSLFQHDPFTWTVEGSDFIREADLTPDAKHWDRALDQWVEQVSQEERERFVDAFYEILTTTQVSSLEELKADWQIHLPTLMQAARQLDPDTRSFLFRTLRRLGTIRRKNVRLP